MQLREMLGLSYKNVRELNNLIDTQIPDRPRFLRRDIEIAGETVSMYSRNVVDCIKALYGNTKFAEHMVFRPERHYDHDNMHQRHYHDLHTGEWWWQTQVCQSLHCLCIGKLTSLIIDYSRGTETWRYYCTHLAVIRPNASDSIWLKNCLPCLSHHWKLTEGYPVQTLSPWSNPPRLPSNNKAQARNQRCSKTTHAPQSISCVFEEDTSATRGYWH
jgi:Plavaka transposase